jgi:hypothetical protein
MADVSTTTREESGILLTLAGQTSVANAGAFSEFVNAFETAITRIL